MGNAKQCNLKELVTVTQFAQEAENVGDCVKHSRAPSCCGLSKGGGQIRTDTMADCQLTADTRRLQ